VHTWVRVEGGGGGARNETGEAGVKSSSKPDVRTSSKSTLVQATTDLHNMVRQNIAFQSIPETKSIFLSVQGVSRL
jgi:hypothetical protein